MPKGPMLKRTRKGALRTPGALATGVAPYAKPPEADGSPSGSDAVVLQLEADELVTESELEEEEEDLALVYESDPAAATDDNAHEGDADDATEGTPEGDGLHGPTDQGRKKNLSVILSEENKRLVGEWLETEAEFIYNKGLTAYEDKAKVWRAFEEKGQSLVPPMSGCELRTWFTSLRSRFGRLTTEKSGQGMGRRLTDREKWILNIFHFLKPHIVRQRKPKVLGLPMAACAAAALPAQALDLPAAPVSSPAPTPTPSPSPVDPASTKARKNQVSELFDVAAFTRAQALPGRYADQYCVKSKPRTGLCTTNYVSKFGALLIDDEVFVFSIDTVVAKVKCHNITTEKLDNLKYVEFWYYKETVSPVLSLFNLMLIVVFAVLSIIIVRNLVIRKVQEILTELRGNNN
ncbi:uncharacterized protein [Macrobrachium rosenbergii]|uniref:uncharacterized protein n=1 Tax=Macrobrachium rosenbergii TaxID=79674 RepID=UPI0034D65909